MSNSELDSVGYRAFGGVDEDLIAPTIIDGAKLKQPVEHIRNDIVGKYHKFEGPYGPKPCIYADWTASGRALKQVENFVAAEVLPFYGNTHTTTSITGNQSTCYRHEARQIIAEATNAKITGKAALDVVIFVGSGTTNAVTKLVHSLDLHIPDGNSVDRPVVFTSCYEHHSNLLPWRESVAEVVTIGYSAATGVCLNDLNEKLQIYSSRSVKIGAFSAASNITGVLTDVDAVAIAMHKAGGVVVFDYASAAPYVKMDMNPVMLGSDAPYAYKDAIFFSGHKFVGGPGCPGVLIAKKRLLMPSSIKPTEPGGGTVFFVTEQHHRYLSNRTEREEGGTPNITGDIRLGLVLHLKQCTGVSWIEQEEKKISLFVEKRLIRHPKIVLLGRGTDAEEGQVKGPSLPIFSFLIRAGARFFHHNFVCALLNDLFGIQSRGGCACAGPFGLSLLGISNVDIASIESALLDKHEILRPGFSRISFPYWMTDAEIDYILSAVEFVADYGHLFIPHYRYNPKTSEWAHTTRLTRFPERKWLSNFKLNSGSYTTSLVDNKSEDANASDSVEPLLSSALEVLKNSWNVTREEDLYQQVNQAVAMELEKAKKIFEKKKFGSAIAIDADLVAFEGIRWFFLSADILTTTWENAPELTVPVPIGPIQPQRWRENSTNERFSFGSERQKGAYAKRREEALPALEGGEVFSGQRAPRYMSFANESVMKNAALSSSNGVTAVAQSDVSAVNMDVPASTDAIKLSEGVRKHSSESPIKTVATTDKSGGGEKVLSGSGKFFHPSRPSPSSGASGDTSGLGKIFVPPQKIMKNVGIAIRDWNMIEEGDRLLLGLSGGKDSLALLHVLLNLQKRSPVKFTLACATVDPQTESFDPSPLIGYVQSLQVPYHYLSEPIVELAKSKLQGDSLCAFCARFKRGLLYSCCRTNGYNKLVLAQHLDDLAESFLMSALHNGQVRTMKANYAIEAGDVNVIRPFAYVREFETRNFSVNAHFPVINENCPACFEIPKERHRIKKLLQQEEAMIPDLFCNLKHAMLPLMDDSIYVTMKGVLKDIKDRETKKRSYVRQDGESQNKRTKHDIASSSVTTNTVPSGTVSDVLTNEIDNVDMSTGLDNNDPLNATVVSSVKCTADFCAPCFELA